MISEQARNRGGTIKGRLAVILAMIMALSLAVLAPSAGAADDDFTWTQQQTGTTMDFTGMWAVDGNNVWAVGASRGDPVAKVMRTRDGGRHWVTQYRLPGTVLWYVSAADLNNVWAVGMGGTILRTTDGGAHWADKGPGFGTELCGVHALDRNRAWVVGDSGTILFTKDGGDHWTDQESGTHAQLWNVSAADERHAWAAGENGTILRTFDGGATWKKQNSGTKDMLICIKAVDSQNAWAAGEGETILRTTDGGKHWVRQDAGVGTEAPLPPVQFCGFWAVNRDVAFAVGWRGTLVSTIDGGATWTKQDTGAVEGLGTVAAGDERHVWAAGNEGTMFYGVKPAPPVEPTTFYLAEGTTAWGFSTYITITNPNTTQVTAKITYLNTAAETGDGVNSTRTINLPPQSQTTVDPRWDLGDTDFSTKVVCPEGKAIAVDRTMTWTGKGASSPEAHNSIGVNSPEVTWYLPEGSSNWGFETWTLIENPNAQDAEVTLTYMTEGQGPKELQKTVPAHSRASYSMEDDIGKADASVEVVSNIPVVAERSMYRHERREGSCSIGTNAAAYDFYLAEGTTAWGFTTYVLVQNPSDEDATVTTWYMTPEGPKEQPKFTMPANSRKTIRVNDALPDSDCSIQVFSETPIIAERAMYWDNGTGEACHDSIGISEGHKAFILPDGQTSDGYETYTLVQNPNEEEVDITVSYLPQDGGEAVTFTDTVPSNSRRTHNMADKGIQGRASVMVTVNGPYGDVIVERSMYWSSRGAGTDTIGAPID